MNKQTTDIKISDIQVSDRFRKDHGDLKELAQSIAELGLLQPIGVTPDNRLVFGERRLKAVRDILGWETIPVLVINIDSMLHGQYAENEHRKDFTISERVAIVNALRSYSHGGDRKSDQVRNGDNDSLTLAEARKQVGFGKDSFYRAEDVVERGIPQLVDAMDAEKLSINAAHELAQATPEEQTEVLTKRFDEGRATGRAIRKQLRFIRSRQAREEAEARTIESPENGDSIQIHHSPFQELESLAGLEPESARLICTDIPYGDDFIGQIEELAEFAERMLMPGGTFVAYFGHHRFNEKLRAMDKHLNFQWISKLTDDGSVMIVIRPHLKKGVISDYVLRTRLALRDYGWKECEELIWFKPDGGNATGSNRRPRRSFEQILWFSKTHDPYIDTKSCGGWSDRLGFEGKNRFGMGPNKPHHNGQLTELKSGKSRSADVIHVPVAKVTTGIMHPAMFPIPLAEHLIKTFCPEGGTVLDPFAGSGSTLIAAKKLGRQFYGFDIMPEYVEMARQRLATINEETEVRDLDYLHQQLRMLLEECLESGGLTSKQHVQNRLRIFEYSQFVAFETTLASMPPKLRDFYESLPHTLAA
jgi:DNA modification methylase/ParB-like chromosome segregation protein Spo0J